MLAEEDVESGEWQCMDATRVPASSTSNESGEGKREITFKN